MTTRYLHNFLIKDLKKKMVFIGGPRQVGKTTMAQNILKHYSKNGMYLNWDSIHDQKKILKQEWFDEQTLIIFDEIHKYPKWKNLIKGIYDTQKDNHNFLVTGSARLDVYRRGGDSLLGRYHHWRLHPFTLNEFISKSLTPKEKFSRLMKVGGFPEVFLDNDQREARRWREERYEKIIKDDIRDLENIKNIQMMSLLLQLLRERAGSEISLSNIAQDIQVSVTTISNWISIFEKMYLIFIVRPYTKNVARSIQKPFKVYFFDNGDVIGDEGAIFENLVANHLLKHYNFLQDYTGEKHELCFIRDKEKREVDFAHIKDGNLEELIEVKFSDNVTSKSLVHMSEKLKPSKATQIIGPNFKKSTTNNLQKIGAIEYFLQTLL